MVNPSLYLLYVLTACVTVSSPGPGVLMTIMKSIRHGWTGAVWAILGTGTGALVMSAISATGVGIILSHSPQAYAALRLVGAAYMVWLGIKNWRAKTVSLERVVEVEDKRETDTGIRPLSFFLEGVTLQMTNPMLIMFFISLFPQFIDPKLSYGMQYCVLALTYFGLIFCIHSGYSIVTSRFRGLLAGERTSRWIYRIGGSIFILLALKVVIDVLA